MLLGETPDVHHQSPQQLALLDLDRRISVDVPAARVAQLGRCGPPELIDAAVVGDPVKPRPQGEVPVACAQAFVGAHEHVLERILGIGHPSREHLAHIGQQARPVAIVNYAKCLVATGAKQRDQLLVRAQAEQWRANPEAGLSKSRPCSDGGSFH